MILHPNCKVNIGLHILDKRLDGYHTLHTLFYPVKGLCDCLEVNKSDVFSFKQSGLVVDCPSENNLVMKCYHAMREQFGRIGDVSIHLEKRIPSGAGLGGGSSDAAHMAIALNEIFNLKLSRNTLAQIVTPLGADCPFFIYNCPCRAEGIGEILTPIDKNTFEGKYIVLVKPDISISTREAYRRLDMLAHIERTPTSNDFEQSVFPLYPVLANIKAKLLEQNAFYASLSGSGATIFGLFEKEPVDMKNIFPNCFVYQGIL